MMQLQDFKVDNAQMKAENIHMWEELEVTDKELWRL